MQEFASTFSVETQTGNEHGAQDNAACDEILLQAVRTIGPGLRPVAIDVPFIFTNDNLDDVLLIVLLLRILWQRTLHVSRETAMIF